MNESYESFDTNQNQVYFNRSDHSRNVGLEKLGQSDEFPSLQQAKIFFRHFLLHGGKSLVLLPAVKNSILGLNSVDMDLDFLNVEMDEFQGDECVNESPMCNREDHLAPPFYAESLAKALTYRPLVYLPVCEAALSSVVESQRVNADSMQQLKRGALTGLGSGRRPMQINLHKSSRFSTKIRQLLAQLQEKFIVVPGIVVQVSKPQAKVEVAVFQCKFCGHRIKQASPVWRETLAAPSFCENAGATVDGPQNLSCKGARDPYFLVTEQSTFLDHQSIKLQELPEDVPTGDMPRQLQLIACRSLCDRVSPGDRINVHGVLTTSQHNQMRFEPDADSSAQSYVHALGFRAASGHNSATGAHLTPEEKAELEKLALQPNIHANIVKSIAPAILGMEKAKRAAACALFGGTRKLQGDGSKTRGDINLLMLGDPSLAKSQILKFVDRVADVSVYTSGKGSSAAGLTAAVVRDKRGVFSLEGGAMVLADGGVVCIDEFDKMRDSDVVAIHEAMEQQTISIAKAGISTVMNARCAVIAAANPSFGSFDDSRDAGSQNNFAATLLSRFDLMLLLRDKEDAKADGLLSKHILQLHSAQPPHVEGVIPLPILKKYIKMAREEYYPLLSREGVGALRKYFVTTRAQARADTRSVRDKLPITIRQLESLVRVSESFARMELSSSADQKHVEMAIDLFTTTTFEVYKNSMFSESLTPAEQRAVQQAEEALLNKLQKNQRVSKHSLLRDMIMGGFEHSILCRAVNILVKKGQLQQRSDRSLKKL